MKYILHHLGLGDHIVCNGMVRYFQKQYGKVAVFCKTTNFNSVEYMYRDNDDIEVMPVPGEIKEVEYIKQLGIQDSTITVGFDKLNWKIFWKLRIPKYRRFDIGFYDSLGLPFSIRFDYFFLLRDLDKEKKIFHELNPDGEDYIFTHGVSPKRVTRDLRIIDNPINHSIFNLLYLIENAVEVHVMESSIKNLINSYRMEKPKFFFHRYVRNNAILYGYAEGLNQYQVVKW